MKQMFVLLVLFFVCRIGLSAEENSGNTGHLMVTVFSSIHDVTKPVTSTGTSWRDLADQAGIPNNGPPLNGHGNQGGEWTIPFEAGLSRILDSYSAQGYEFVAYSHPTLILMRQQ